MSLVGNKIVTAGITLNGPITVSGSAVFSAGLSAADATFSGNLNVGFTYGFGITLATNAIKRDLGQKLRDFCNVKDFGAVGDGAGVGGLVFVDTISL